VIFLTCHACSHRDEYSEPVRCFPFWNCVQCGEWEHFEGEVDARDCKNLDEVADAFSEVEKYDLRVGHVILPSGIYFPPDVLDDGGIKLWGANAVPLGCFRIWDVEEL